MARRGKPTRIPGARAERRVEVRFTDAEYLDLSLLAVSFQLSMADTIRLALADLRDDVDDAGIRAGSNSTEAAHSPQESRRHSFEGRASGARGLSKRRTGVRPFCSLGE